LSWDLANFSPPCLVWNLDPPWSQLPA
jgi:hypothetical protein